MAIVHAFWGRGKDFLPKKGPGGGGQSVGHGSDARKTCVPAVRRVRCKIRRRTPAVPPH